MSRRQRRDFSTRRAAPLRQRLQVAWPRLQMSLIVGLTAGAGFLSSVGLLALGMTQMWLRYALCVVVAYVVFLLLIGVWRQAKKWDFSPDGFGSGHDSAADAPRWSGEGGSSGGAGTSASFDGAPSIAEVDIPVVSGLPDVDADIGEGIWLLPLLVIAAGMAFAALWLVWVAPALLAEVALDAALSAGLYRRVRRSTDGDWVLTTFRYSWKPFLAGMICALIVGVIAGLLAPDASTLGQAASYLANR